MAVFQPPSAKRTRLHPQVKRQIDRWRLCLAGGASVVVRMLLHWPTLPSLPAIIAAVAVSVTVGIVFGYSGIIPRGKLRASTRSRRCGMNDHSVPANYPAGFRGADCPQSAARGKGRQA
jgi:hypothetical protein